MLHTPTSRKINQARHRRALLGPADQFTMHGQATGTITWVSA